MSRSHSYIDTARRIIESYDGLVPLAIFLKRYFAANKKHGSRDRKWITSLCYNYFRAARAIRSEALDERILLAAFICGGVTDNLVAELKPELASGIGKGIDERIQLVADHFDTSQLFPCEAVLSDGIDPKAFSLSFLQQPDLFIRIRPGHEQQVLHKLTQATLAFQRPNDQAVALPNSSKLDDVLDIDAEAVIQDLNSQATGLLMKPFIEALRTNHGGRTGQLSVWDCCAASGGKSIMLHDFFSPIHITVSDIRRPILYNLEKRMQRAGVKVQRSFVADLEQGPTAAVTHASFDVVLADVPCTGSGTWARTPEQLHYFDAARIAGFAERQERIVSNALPGLRPHGLLIYITCSVFRSENEDVVQAIASKHDLDISMMQAIPGHGQKADSMFIAILKKKDHH